MVKSSTPGNKMIDQGKITNYIFLTPIVTRKAFVDLKLQQKPLNVITLGHTESDNINRMITLTGNFYLAVYNKWDLWKVITLSG